MRDAILMVFLQSVLAAVIISGCGGFFQRAGTHDGLDYAVEHGRMMLRIEEAGVKDPLVLEAIRAVPRHKFVPENLRDIAYIPKAVPPDPVLFARMVELLGLKEGDNVLQLGTGSGYEAAVLSRIAGRVYSVEILPRLASGAAKRLKELGYSNVIVRCSDPAAGWEEHAPFDAILATEPFSKIPQALVNQLKEEGPMVIPGGTTFTEENIRFITKKEGVVVFEDAFSSPPAPASVEQDGERKRKEAEK